MADFASPEWIRELDEALRDSDALREATADLALTIRQTITEPDGSDRSWHIVADHGDVRAEAGPGDAADVTFTYDDDTARKVGSGAISVQTAFMIGRLRIGGDTAKLMQYAPAFDGMADVFDQLRERTTY